VGDAVDVDCGGIPNGLGYLYIVEKEVHLHGLHGRTHSEVGTGVPRLPPSARRWYRLT
jgi:hypothetical protein